MDKNNTSTTQVPVFFSAYSPSDLQAMIEQAVEKKLLQHLSNMNNTLDPAELLTRAEAAKEFKISISNLDNYRRDGLIIPCRVRGTVRYRRGDLTRLFSGNILNPYKAPKNGKK